MPHGLTIDPHGNYWMTDVAMHQALKVFMNVFIVVTKLKYILYALVQALRK